MVALIVYCMTCVMSYCDAAVTLDASGRVTGVTDVTVGSVIYDVVMRVEKGTTLWPDMTQATFWNNPKAAEDLIKAINIQLNALTPIPSEVADPSGAVAGFDTLYKIPVEPYPLVPTAVITVYGRYDSVVGWYGPQTGSDYKDSDSSAWVTISNQKIIPTPSALVLSVIGVSSLMAAHRRRRRQ